MSRRETEAARRSVGETDGHRSGWGYKAPTLPPAAPSDPELRWNRLPLAPPGLNKASSVPPSCVQTGPARLPPQLFLFWDPELGEKMG